MHSAARCLVTLLCAIAWTANAAPMTYRYFGQVSSASDASVIGAPITITVNFDPATALVDYNNGVDTAFLASYSGNAYGTPWVTWLSVTAEYAGHTFANDLFNGDINLGHAQSILDNAVQSSVTHIDSYQPFIAVQRVINSIGTVIQERNATWYVQSIASISDLSPGGQYNLTNGLNFPQSIDLSKGREQYGELNSLDPGGKSYYVDFTLNRLDVTAVPEPATLALFGLALAGLVVLRRPMGMPQQRGV